MGPNGTARDMRPSNKYFNFLAFLLDLTPFCVKLLMELMWFSRLMNLLKLISDLSSAIKEERQKYKREIERARVSEQTCRSVLRVFPALSDVVRRRYRACADKSNILWTARGDAVMRIACESVVNAQTALAVSLGIGNLLPIKTGCSAPNALATLLQDSRCTWIQASAAFASFLSLR